jgi:light-regulated signal transduction histidine kinase (bacteriophytochrome)
MFSFLGLDPARDTASFEAWRAALHPADRAAAEAKIQAAVRDHVRLENEFRVVLPAGGIRWISALGDTTYDEAGKPLRMSGVCLDVTGRKLAEIELQNLTARLKSANEELEAFAYSVSHDLRAPLRSIDGFSRIVLEDCSARLDDNGRKHLARVRAASQRMGELIDDLLKLSRTVRTEMRIQKLDLSALGRETVANLQEAEPARPVEWVVAPGLEAVADRALMRLVLQNLLGNAWKFTGRRAGGARIEFGRQEGGDGPAFFVRDNGAGYDPKFADKLFVPFQRLHAQEEFAGNGIGLATVQRIIHRHGGRLWAEGQPGQGATFYFTLPESIPST